MAVYLGLNQVGIANLIEKPDDQYGFLKNSQLIKTVTYDLLLSNTNFSSLTISTTNQGLTLPATDYSNAGTSIIVDRIGEAYDGTIINRNEHDYVVLCKGYWTYAFTVNEATINTLIHGVKTGICRDFQAGKYNTINTAGTLNATNTFGTAYLASSAVLLYRKVNGQYATATNTGIYTTSQTASFAAASGQDYCNLLLGGLGVKASASYFPVDAMNYIDPANTTLHFIWEIYEGDKNIYSTIYQTAYNYVALS